LILYIYLRLLLVYRNKLCESYTFALSQYLFENDEQVVDFLVDSNDSIESIYGQTHVFLSRYCISLQYFFTRDDQTQIHDLMEKTSIMKFQDTKNINIGTHDFPKYINLGTSCKKEQIDQYTCLFK